MKHIFKINRLAKTLLISCCLTSCNYLEVLPPAQPELKDTMKDEATTLGFLYSCYYGTVDVQPFYFQKTENSTDEKVIPPEYDYWPQRIAWGMANAGDASAEIWDDNYNHIGYVQKFLGLIDGFHPVGVTQEEKEQYKAECYFLEGYYHMRVLQAYGPCPIIPAKPDPGISKYDIPGRSHFDYCVDWIVDKFDQAAAILPPTRTETRELGRVTSTICKAMKARLLLYAASPLWNGNFPFPDWRNKNWETPGYGKELVSNTYSEEKWQRALTACQEALEAAQEAGYKLFDVETANAKAELDKVPLPFVPGKEAETEENNAFKERVRMFQYLSTANEGDGNKELIWGIRIDQSKNNGGDEISSRMPARVVKKSNGSFVGGWSACAPTLYAAQHFYTENGLLPTRDPKYFGESDWFTRYYEGKESPELATDQLDSEDVKNDIIKMHVGREARFYAWIAFDGCEFASKLNDGKPLWVNFKNTNTNGWNPASKRNCAGTGYLSKKFIDPNILYRKNGEKSFTAVRFPYIRLAELYLNLAECYAALGQEEPAMDNLNIIRQRAGLSDLVSKDITSDMTITDWVRTERFIELYEEGHRYYDLRRWTTAPERLKAGSYYSLNGLGIANPSFEEFNTPIQINQPFKWDNRMYLLPVHAGNGELYSNPQMVQAPNY